MSKIDFFIHAMAGMLAASNEMYGAPLLPANRPRKDMRTSKEKKKCKSCAYYSKVAGLPQCDIFARTRIHMSPLNPVCSNYKKRKK